MFQMAIQPKLMEIRHLEEEDKRRFRESYISSDSREMGGGSGQYTNLSPRQKPAMGNRYSLVSDASSNTTSGIASDKMTVSFEENEETCREIIIDSPPLPMLLNTPSQTRTKLMSTLPGYKPSPVPGANRSPVLDHNDLYYAHTFPSNRLSGSTLATATPPFHVNRQNNISSGSIQSDRSGSGQSESQSLGSGSSGSYRKMMKPSGMYSPVMPVYPQHMHVETGAREKTSRPTSRSASRKDSFKKEILAQLHAHSGGGAVLPMPQPHLVDTPQLKHVPSFHMEDLDYLPRPVSQSGSSDHRTNRSYGSDLSNHSSLHVSGCTVTSIHMNQTSQGSVASFSSGEGMLQEAEEILLPPGSFADERSLADIPAEPIHLQSQSETEQALSELQDNDLPHAAADVQITQSEADLLETVGASAISAGPGAKKVRPTHITVMNQKEVLHPEIEEIRGQSHAFSLPFITALCNDKSLLPLHSNSGSIAGSYDMSSIRSTDSRISRISHETDVRRLSVNYPSSANGTLVNTYSNSRPFSWHSESFDLDSQLASLNVNSSPLAENHRSVPQSLYDFTSPEASASWTNAISYGLPSRGGMDRYSPELIASQLMIPPKISSGGHSSTEANIRHKTLMKENIGIA